MFCGGGGGGDGISEKCQNDAMKVIKDKIDKVISGSIIKLTCSMTKEKLHHFHLVNILLVKS